MIFHLGEAHDRSRFDTVGNVDTSKRSYDAALEPLGVVSIQCLTITIGKFGTRRPAKMCPRYF